MASLLTAAQMRAIERAAIDQGLVTGLELMERAGVGVVAALLETWPGFARPPQVAAPAVQTHPATTTLPEVLPECDPQCAPEFSAECTPECTPESLAFRAGRQTRSGADTASKDAAPHWRAHVLCGPGNNGGDGFVVARLLHARDWSVSVFFMGDPADLPADARRNYDRWAEFGAIVPLELLLQNEPGPCDFPGNCDLIVDALFGTGLTRGIKGTSRLFGEIETLVNAPPAKVAPRAARARVVSVDIPSGICADSGREFSQEAPGGKASICADLTVTFHAAKIGHCLLPGALRAGRLVVKDIGLPKAGAPNTTARNTVCHRAAPLVQKLRKPGAAHKFSSGHALVLSGGAGCTGAARLAARGALRVGAGLVTLGVPAAAQQEVATQVTAIMLRRIGDPGVFARILEEGRINALCIGPGFGLKDPQAALLARALETGRATVLDADALTLIARDPTLFARLHPNCVLTPHGGEFARLFPDIAARLAAPPKSGPAFSKRDATHAAAVRAGCTVIFKGADTVIATHDGAGFINAGFGDASAPWLATAGSGDVLAGFVTGLLARGFGVADAAQTGVWLHLACARAFGPGLIAEDLPEQLPVVLREVLGAGLGGSSEGGGAPKIRGPK